MYDIVDALNATELYALKWLVGKLSKYFTIKYTK